MGMGIQRIIGASPQDEAQDSLRHESLLGVADRRYSFLRTRTRVLYCGCTPFLRYLTSLPRYTYLYQINRSTTDPSGFIGRHACLSTGEE